MKTATAFALMVAMVAFFGGCKQKSEVEAPVTAAKAPAASGNHDAGGPISEAALGLKLYPGARVVTSGETDDLVSANLETADPVEKVIAFYQKELGLPEGGAATMDLDAKKNGRRYVITTNSSGGKTAVSIMGKK